MVPPVQRVSNAFGKKRGFEIEEILIVAHGGNRNDTLVTVERKQSLEEQGIKGEHHCHFIPCPICETMEEQGIKEG